MGRVLPDWLSAYIQYTDNTEPRFSYRMWAGVSAIAAALQRKCFLQLGMEIFFPNFYIVLVGPPAARKGTAIKPAKQLMDAIGIMPAADESSRQKLVNALVESSSVDTDPETDLTYIHSSLTIVASELTVFIGYQNIDFLTVLCKWYDCENRFVYDTHIHGKQEVTNLWVNLMGATTPLLIQTSLPAGAIGSGFASRTIFVYEDDKEKVVIEPMLTKEQEVIGEGLRQDLGDINTMCGRFYYDQEFLSAYGRWRTEAEETPGRFSEHLEYYAQRRHVHLLKLCMVFSASHGTSMKIGIDEFNRARSLLEYTEQHMACTFQGLGGNPLASTQIKVMRVVAEEKQVTFQRLLNRFYQDVNTTDLSAILTTMEHMGFCKMDLKTKLVLWTGKEET